MDALERFTNKCLELVGEQHFLIDAIKAGAVRKLESKEIENMARLYILLISIGYLGHNDQSSKSDALNIVYSSYLSARNEMLSWREISDSATR